MYELQPISSKRLRWAQTVLLLELLSLSQSNAIDVVYWPTMDPTVVSGTREQILESYREVRDHLAGLIESRLLKRNGIAAQSA